MFSSLSRQRYWGIIFFIATLFSIITYQLIQLTIVRRPALLHVAERQHSIRIDVPPFRGQILDRNGKEFATNLNVPSIYAVPRMIAKQEIPALARTLADILSLSPQFVEGRLDRDKAFVWLKRKVSFEESAAIRNLELPGLGIVEEPRRFYPQGDMLSQILGITDIDNRGMEGIELVLNRELRGRPGFRHTKRDALGREVKAFETQVVPAVDGNKVYLTVDQYIQYLTERALDEAYTKWNAEGAWAVVMHAQTGEIMALANRPTFDPNKFQSSKADHRRNRTVTDMYEPGSVFKIVTAAAVLNEGAASLDTPIFCENGEYRYGSRTLHDVHPYGKLSMADVIIKSSNIGTVKLAAMLDQDVFYQYIKDFGFFGRSGIDLPGEAAGFVRHPSQWSKTSPYNIPMGHEVMVTALQMTAAMGVIANGGELMKPYIVSRIEDQAGVVLKKNLPEVKRRVLNQETVEKLRHVLWRAVEEGTGTNAKIKGMPVAGKTGTAQKVLPDGRGYSHDQFMSSFVGFAPADNPQLVMAVVLDNPQPKYYGGTVAAPVFQQVMKAALVYLGFYPSENVRDISLPKPSAAMGLRAGEERPENLPTLLTARTAG